MLAENDVLQQELTKVKSEHERAVKVRVFKVT